jgi:hypothetical protein
MVFLYLIIPQTFLFFISLSVYVTWLVGKPALKSLQDGPKVSQTTFENRAWKIFCIFLSVNWLLSHSMLCNMLREGYSGSGSRLWEHSNFGLFWSLWKGTCLCHYVLIHVVSLVLHGSWNCKYLWSKSNCCRFQNQLSFDGTLLVLWNTKRIDN